MDEIHVHFLSCLVFRTDVTISRQFATNPQPFRT